MFAKGKGKHATGCRDGQTCRSPDGGGMGVVVVGGGGWVVFAK